MPRFALLPAIAFFAVAFAFTTSAFATDPAYVGTWGKDAAQCALPQEVEGAPLIIGTERYDQHEAHCLFAGIRADGNNWSIDTICSVQGDEQKDIFNVSVEGDTLTLGSGTSQQTLIRCP